MITMIGSNMTKNNNKRRELGLSPLWDIAVRDVFQHTANNLFDSFGSTSNITRSSVSESNDKLTVTLDAPGRAAADFRVSVDWTTLVINAPATGARPALHESWDLGCVVEHADVAARYEAGVLHVEVDLSKRPKRSFDVTVK